MSVSIFLWITAVLIQNAVSMGDPDPIPKPKGTPGNHETIHIANATQQPLVDENSSPSTKEIRDASLAIALVFCGCTTVLLLLILSLYTLKRMRKSQLGPIENEPKEQLTVNFKYDREKNELREGRFNIDSSRILGEGNFGTVYEGTLKLNDEGDEIKVAFKSTTCSSRFTDLDAIFQEIRILSHVGQHENVVKFYGACTSFYTQGIIYVALEYCELGSLDRYLKKIEFNAMRQAELEAEIALQNSPAGSHYKSQQILVECNGLTLQAASSSWSSILQAVTDTELQVDEALKWAKEIAEGMEHLTSRNVIHADLATRNLLLTANKSIKITDFGLSKKIYAKIDNTRTCTMDKNQRLPWKWLAPESLEKQVFSPKSDVWSYGIVLWEIFSLGKSPYSEFHTYKELRDNLKDNWRLEQPSLCPNETYKLMSQCWKYESVERPTFTEIKKILSPQAENYVVIGIEN